MHRQKSQVSILFWQKKAKGAPARPLLREKSPSAFAGIVGKKGKRGEEIVAWVGMAFSDHRPENQ
jgi:hypothetical protein